MQQTWSETEFRNYAYYSLGRNGLQMWAIRCFLEQMSKLICSGLAGNILPDPTKTRVSPEQAEESMNRLVRELQHEKDNRGHDWKQVTEFTEIPILAKIAIAQGIQELLNKDWSAKLERK